MSGHLITEAGGGDQPFSATCSCGQTSGPCRYEWEREDWIHLHRANAERARTARQRTPSLKATAAHYRAMAQDPTIPTGEREQWESLASEIELRLANAQPLSDEDQLPLF